MDNVSYFYSVLGSLLLPDDWLKTQTFIYSFNFYNSLVGCLKKPELTLPDLMVPSAEVSAKFELEFNDTLVDTHTQSKKYT